MFSSAQLSHWLELPLPNTLEQIEYRSLETDSRLVDQYSVFIALPGVTSNGWDYLEQVAEKGCTLALVPQGLQIVHDKISIIEVAGLEEVLGALVRQVYGPAPEHIVAVTGTNGKSSTCFYIAQLANQIGFNSAMVGTFGIGPLDQLEEAKQTTPDLLTLHKLLSKFAQQGIDFVAFEASSHALDQKRLAGVPVTTAVFTNLTRDHLDYHGSMEQYAMAKSKLFGFSGLQRSVICIDSDYGQYMAEKSVAPVWTYSQGAGADFSVVSKNYLQTGVQLELLLCGVTYEVFLPLLGGFNVQNALAALASVWRVAPSKGELVAALANLNGAPGRMEPVKVTSAPLVLVDYAHTSDALDMALSAVRAHVPGRLICVFGCGGDRDKGKRPMMLQAAQQYADEVWVTSDNPRSESPKAIIDEVLSGQNLALSKQLHVVVDRSDAITKAVATAQPEDIVLIAGKGHETYQEVMGVRHHFDDREEALKALNAYVKQS
ncbi:UDP-N-acetylmuramoyl-L-alanyl-D-glutamate--2,6-diaminopimelate ligase [Rhodanobacter aciditrophus]|uniref:UDP-N-acetylmuramoyl-L-alanyl-D-glutamate--2,6-diaminopimelate ligase n=1 Tax=Rhodanobacter aciditrophus TaxID=1623218 RepID=A0ABW4B5X5_9GAMM